MLETLLNFFSFSSKGGSPPEEGRPAYRLPAGRQGRQAPLAENF